MRSRLPSCAITPLILALALTLTRSGPAAAQETDPHAGHGMEGGLLADLMNDIAQVEEKLVALAGAMPAETWTWRPGEGVRSTREVFLHVASDNYFLPTAVGVAAPEETGIRGDDFATPVAYEKRELDPAATATALRASFAHLNRALQTPTSPRWAARSACSAAPRRGGSCGSSPPCTCTNTSVS